MKRNSALILGDTIAIAILTIIGFASHGEANPSFIPRMGTTFFPVLIGWFLLAPWFGLFDENVNASSKLLWRVPFAMFFVAPLATVLRAVMLGSAAAPLFALVLGFTSAVGMFVWRMIYGFVLKRRRK